jgi:hypothetical protein
VPIRVPWLQAADRSPIHQQHPPPHPLCHQIHYQIHLPLHLRRHLYQIDRHLSRLRTDSSRILTPGRHHTAPTAHTGHRDMAATHTHRIRVSAHILPLTRQWDGTIIIQDITQECMGAV